MQLTMLNRVGALVRIFEDLAKKEGTVRPQDSMEPSMSQPQPKTRAPRALVKRMCCKAVFCKDLNSSKTMSPISDQTLKGTTPKDAKK